MIYEMKLNAETFEKMKTGIKTVEIRLLDEKRRKPKAGDEIKFFKLPEKKRINNRESEKAGKILKFQKNV